MRDSQIFISFTMKINCILRSAIRIKVTCFKMRTSSENKTHFKSMPHLNFNASDAILVKNVPLLQTVVNSFIIPVNCIIFTASRTSYKHMREDDKIQIKITTMEAKVNALSLTLRVLECCSEERFIMKSSNIAVNGRRFFCRRCILKNPNLFFKLSFCNIFSTS